MKIILSMSTQEIEQYTKELASNHAEYAAAQGYQYKCFTERHASFTEYHPSYSRLGFLLDAMKEGYDPIVWADIDVAFLDYTWDIASLLDYGKADAAFGLPDWQIQWGKTGGVWMAAYKQGNWPSTYVCFGLVAFANNWLSKAFLEEVARLSKNPNMQDTSCHEQLYVNEELVRVNFAGVRACSPQEIGCFATELCDDHNQWQAGYPIVHLASGPWLLRQEAFVNTYGPTIKRA